MSSLPTAFASLAEPTETPLLIGFADLTHFSRTVRSMPDAQMARMCQEFYRRVGDAVVRSGGVVVKFMGDAALVAYPRDAAEAGALSLLQVKRTIDSWMSEMKLPCRLIVKVHVGTAIAGPFGAAGNARFDILGNDVNLTAMLDSSGFAMTAEAFRALSPDARKSFKKHTLPITYIPLEQRHGC